MRLTENEISAIRRNILQFDPDPKEQMKMQTIMWFLFSGILPFLIETLKMQNNIPGNFID